MTACCNRLVRALPAFGGPSTSGGLSQTFRRVTDRRESFGTRRRKRARRCGCEKQKSNRQARTATQHIRRLLKLKLYVYAKRNVSGANAWVVTRCLPIWIFARKNFQVDAKSHLRAAVRCHITITTMSLDSRNLMDLSGSFPTIGEPRKIRFEILAVRKFCEYFSS